MSSHTVLVTGATGTVDRQVVRGLLKADQRVRAVTRCPARSALPREVDVRGGDLAEPSSIVPALAGVDRLYLFPAGNMAAACAAARDAAVEHVVLLSSASAGYARPDHSSLHHRAAEQAVLDCGLPHTLLRPGAFMGNDLAWGPEIAVRAKVSLAYPDAATAPIDERDIAAVATAALLSPGLVGSTITLTGPESLSQRRRVDLLAQATGETIKLLELTPDAAREQMASYLPAEAVDLILGVLATAPPVTVTRPASTDLLGREPYRYGDWAIHHAQAFTHAASATARN